VKYKEEKKTKEKLLANSEWQPNLFNDSAEVE
jgi:hypothetical protein